MDIAAGTPSSKALDHLVGKTLDRDRAGGEAVEADDCRNDDSPEDEPFDLDQDCLILFAFRK